MARTKTSSALPTTRLTADERRDAIVAAAVHEFARGGYAGTSTESIARRAGVSQPYLFQLFGTKRDLFLAAVRRCFERTRTTFETVGRAARAGGADAHVTLDAMGGAYADLLKDRELLLLQLHAYAACEDPAIREVVRSEFAALTRSVSEVSGASGEQLELWFAIGMLMNVGAAIGADRIEELVPGGPYLKHKGAHGR